MWLDLLINVGPIALFLILGFSVGGFVERRHFKRLAAREAALGDMLVTDLRAIPRGAEPGSSAFVAGEVVVASDYFKSFAAALRKLVGGELLTYESLMDRARREAQLRMMESARSMGATHVINVRFATSNIGGTARRRAAAMVEMFAYGTAVRVSPPTAS